MSWDFYVREFWGESLPLCGWLYRSLFISIFSHRYSYLSNHHLCQRRRRHFSRILFEIYNAFTSNGNDIEAKWNDTSIIGVFSVSKQNKATYSKIWSEAKQSEEYYYYFLQDRRKSEHIKSRMCWIEEKTNIISLKPCSIEAKRTDLIKIYVRSNKNVPGESKTLQNQNKANIISPFTK